MAKGDEYLDYRDETLEQTAKPWNILLGAFLKMETQTTYLGTFQKEFSQVAFFFLEHDGSIRGRVTDRYR